MKLLKILALLVTTFNVQAFDAVKLDKVISDFLYNLNRAKCGSVEYSILSAYYVGRAYDKGFYGSWKPSQLVPPVELSDIDVDVETKICGLEDGYGFFVREDEIGDYKIIHYSSFSQPE